MVVNLAGGNSENEILDKEILELQKKSQIYNNIPLNSVQCLDIHETVFNTSTILVSDGKIDNSNFYIVISDLESDNKKDNILLTACIFDAFLLLQKHYYIINTVILIWIDQPLLNLGKKSHGKLKADQ